MPERHTVDIEPATVADIPELCCLLDALFAQEAEFTPDRQLQERGVRAILGNRATGEIFLARRHGEVIGMVNLLYTVSTALGAPVALLEDLVVARDSRGQGVGAQLLNCALARAREKGCRRVSLLTDDDNNDAHTFYQNQGFHRSSMVLYRKALDAD